MFKTIQLPINVSLWTRIDEVLAETGTSRTTFIHNALEQALERLLRQWRIRELEKKHALGYAKVPVESGEFDVWFDEQVWDEE